MANPSTIVETTTPVRPWDPTSLTAYLGLSYVDLRFSGGGGDVTPMRLLANGDVRLYGELLMETGLVRSYDGFGFTSYGTTEPLVSFRYGAGVGTEMLRINNDGSVQSRSGASLALKGEVPSGGTTGMELSVSNDAPSGKSVLLVKELTGTVLTLSGRSTPAGGQAVLRGYGANGFRLLAQDAGISQYRALELAGASLRILCHNSLSLLEWGTLDVTALGVSTIDTTRKLVLTANDSGTYKDVEITGSNMVLTAHGGYARVKDAGGVVRFEVDTALGDLVVTSPSNYSADLVLDSTTTGGAKKWRLSSTVTTGKLRLLNETDSVTVTVDTDGSVYSPGFVGTQVVSSVPGSGDAQAGAMVVYASGSTYRLYVKVDSTTWKSVTL